MKANDLLPTKKEIELIKEALDYLRGPGFKGFCKYHAAELKKKEQRGRTPKSVYTSR